MPLHFGKIFGAIALLTVAAFVAWLLFTTFFATEEADQQMERTGAVKLGGGLSSTMAQATDQNRVAMATASAAPSTP
jgi:hypothetical protein